LVLFRRSILRYMERKKVPDYTNFIKLIRLPNVFVVTDSEYSKHSIQYFLGSSKNEINVLYAPISNEFFVKKESVEKIGIESKKYFLLVSVDRCYKNVILLLEQWEKFCASTNNEYYCVLVGKINVEMRNCIIVEKADSNVLVHLYKNAFALVYPSFVEGFGYPPIEAAVYATPSICANVTSIPEICGDMPIYFSPFYPEDLFRAMIMMTKNRDIYVEKAKKRFLEIDKIQKNDLQRLMDLILK
jgi:glycosyltransferase involved in cell wall biosynthesis